MIRFFRKGEDAPETPATESRPHGEKEATGRTEATSDSNGGSRGWLSRLRQGLARSSSRLTESINGVFQQAGGLAQKAGETVVGLVVRRRLDEAMLQELEDALIAADLGPATAAQLVAALRRQRLNQDVSSEEVRALLAEEITRVLDPVARPLTLDPSRRPHVILVVGVNGSGKTTTIGKLAKLYGDEGKRVVLAAGDTFRAAAVEQLKIWSERAGAQVVSRETGADAAGLAYDALALARKEGADLLLIDTAGRLHNKDSLMAELEKTIRVLRKLDPTAPHDCLLVLDAVTGQNAHQQVEVFRERIQVSGLIVTKLDGTARGGVLVALAQRFGLPVHAIGVGEGADDLRPFAAAAFARSLMGLPAA
ncbi:MAG: signal recognition particle-docking protein FtsY [Rhodospirillaceae bacterium]|nr:signal recognition particle-docking protein FtsY [Rhodospirillaceae bacterium]